MENDPARWANPGGRVYIQALKGVQPSLDKGRLQVISSKERRGGNLIYCYGNGTGAGMEVKGALKPQTEMAS